MGERGQSPRETVPYKGNIDSWQEAFEVEITKAVRWDGPNTIAVRVEDNVGAGGIWRPVWLVVCDAPINPELNLIGNGGFEDDENGWLKNTMCGQFEFAIDKAEFHSGHASARLTCVQLSSKEPEEKFRTRAWARWYRTDVPVVKGKSYSLRAWVKTSKDFGGKAVIFLIPDLKERTKTATMLNTEALWREVTIRDFVPTADSAAVYPNVYDAIGTVWFDDVELVCDDR